MSPGLDISPLYDLRLRTPRLELRLPREEELVTLAGVARAGVHGPDEMPFLVPWTDHVHSPTFVAAFVEYHLEQRRAWSIDEWHLELGVWAGSELLGAQAINAREFGGVGTVRSGSWLGRRFHGRGFGTEMRGAVLDLAFRGLGAVEARTGAFEDNPASAAVSLKLGYEEVGERFNEVRGAQVRERLFALSADAWRARRYPRARIEGLDGSRHLFGATG